jgi:hypothetical protein
VFADVPFCDEGAFKVFAVQIDFVLAGDAFWRRVSCVRHIRRVYPYFAIGDAVALAVGDAPITKDINVRPLSLSEITAAYRAGWKTHSGKQNEFSRGRRAMNFGQEDSDAIAIHLKVAGGRGHRCWYKQSW